MRFLVDAQLPKKLSYILTRRGHDSIHVVRLALRELTEDKEIIRIADEEKRIVVSKDYDFVDSIRFCIGRSPKSCCISQPEIRRIRN